MATVTLILPLEATTVKNPIYSRSDSMSDSRGESGATAGATAVAAGQQRTDSKAIAERHQIDSRSDSILTAGAIEGATEVVTEGALID